MAIFYNHIKGCGNLATNTHSGTYPHGEGTLEYTDAWTFIKFADVLYYTKEKASDTSCLNRIENSPIIYLQSPNCYSKYVSNFCYSKDYDSKFGPGGVPDENYRFADGSYSLGHILTTNATEQYVNNAFYYNDEVNIKNNLGVAKEVILGLEWDENEHKLKEEKRTIALNGEKTSVVGVDATHNLAFTHGSVLYFTDSAPWDRSTRPRDEWEEGEDGWGDYGAIYKDDDSVIFESTKSGKKGHQRGYFAFSSLKVENTEGQTDAEFIVRGKCEALYFNATSDRRAKTNIIPAEFSALSVVNSTPTYIFNYNNNEEKTIGLIAQEAAEFNLDGFNMVDNLAATGQDGDFMQMKESKLVYVLWKAVQELSAEVEDLKSQIRNLK